MKNYFPFLFASLLLFYIVSTGCKKEPDPKIEDYQTIVEGTVKDITTNIPIRGSKLILTAELIDKFSSHPSGVAHTFSDSNGYFYLKFTHNSDYYYEIIGFHENYFDESSQSTTPTRKLIDPYSKNIVNLFLQPKAWLKIFVKNVNPVDNSDVIDLSGLFNHPQTIIFGGMNVDTYTIGMCQGNKQNKFRWHIRKNGLFTTFNDSLFFPAFDTTEYFINY